MENSLYDLYKDEDIVSTSREILEKFIRELLSLTNLVKILYKALYPSIIDENNMAPNTQHGKIILPEKLDDKENRFNNDYFDRVVWFTEDLISGDRLNFCERYLHLAGYEQMFDDIIEYFQTVKAPAKGLRSFDTVSGLRIMANIIPEGSRREMVRIIDPNSKRTMCIIREKMVNPYGSDDNKN